MRRGRPPTPSAEMIRQYLAGDSISTVADRHGVSPATVRRALDRAGVDRSATEKAREHERDASIIRLRNDLGLSWPDISEGTGIPISTLQARYAKATRRTNAGRDRPEKDSAIPWQALVAKYQAGDTTLTDLALELHMDARTVRHHLQVHGAELKDANKPLTLQLSDDELRHRRAAGETYKELARQAGASTAHIWRRVNFRT